MDRIEPPWTKERLEAWTKERAEGIQYYALGKPVYCPPHNWEYKDVETSSE